MSAVHGDGFHASDGLNLCKQLTVLLILGTVATARARKRYSSSGLALVQLEMCRARRVSDGRECVFCAIGVGHRKVLSKEVH